MADPLEEAVERVTARIHRHTNDSQPEIVAGDLRTILAALSAAEARERVIPPEQHEKVVQAFRQRLHKHFHKWVTHRTAKAIVDEVARALTPEPSHAQ